MIRRLTAALTLLATAGLAVLVQSAPASAAPYPPQNPAAISASVYDPCAGTANQIGGTGFQAGETVRLTLGGSGELGRPVVAGDGTFSLTVTVPADARGDRQVTALGLTSGQTASLTLAIANCVRGASNGGGGLAYTGVAIGGALLAVVLLLGAGAALVVAGRRRRDGAAIG